MRFVELNITVFFVQRFFEKKNIFASVWTVDNTSTRFRAERSLFDRYAQLKIDRFETRTGKSREKYIFYCPSSSG